MPEKRWDGQVDVNFKSIWMGTTAAARRMHEGGILNITSIGARHPRPMFGPLTATKAAANHLTETLAIELLPRIRVNDIGPGAIMTAPNAGRSAGICNYGRRGGSNDAL